MINKMKSTIKHILSYMLILIIPLAAMTVSAQQSYSPAKVVYDISSPDAESLSHMLDRTSLLQKLYQNDSFNASIIFIIHEGAIPLFVKDNAMYEELMQRANSLTLGEIIQFKICRASAKMQGYKDNDFHDFAVVVPMADAEIIKLQHNGYAYMR
jgi:intracellular sulfur oxidation DsrE/DsrF family protein